MRSVMIFGAAGNVGIELVEVFRAAGWAVIPMIRGLCDLHDPVDTIKEILDTVSAVREAEHSFDLVINAAAFNGMEQCEADRYRAFQVNVAAPAAMAISAIKLGVPFIHFSTDYVFSGHDLALHERLPKNPCGAYGRSKSMGEDAVLEQGGRNLILRLSSVFGRKWAGPLGVVAQALNGRGSPSDPVQVLRQFACITSAKMIAEATLKAADVMISNDKVGGIYHLASRQPCWKRDHAKSVLEAVLGRRKGGWHVREGELAVARPVSTALQTNNFCHAFGVKLPTWEEDLQDILPLLPPVELHPDLVADQPAVAAD